MYDRYQGLIFDMDGTILDTEPTHRKAWHEVLSRYGMTFDEAAMVALSGSPTWRIAQAILAILLANATATTLYGLRTSKSAAHFFGPVPSLRLKRNTA